MTTNTDCTGPILLVEDNEDDVFIFRRAYKQAGLTHPLQVVMDGQEATDYLHGESAFADRTRFPVPLLILLDLKLPFKPGLEILAMIRSSPRLANLSVIVLTSSAEQRDISRAQELRAQAFLVKPPGAPTLLAAMQSIRSRTDNASSGAGWPKIPGDMFETGALGITPSTLSPSR
jgi:CheY-like chemotaxis protein